jgi:hypothetical protein
MKGAAQMNQIVRILGAAGALIAGPSFVLNTYAHDGIMPTADDVDRLDGVFSLLFMAGAALCVAALIFVRPSPLGRRGRWLLYVEAGMVVMGAVWAGFIVADPDNLGSSNPLVVIGDACWPLHQVFMLVVGIAIVRTGTWRAPLRYAAFGPVLGIVTLFAGVNAGLDYVSAAGIGGGWAIVGAGLALGPGRPRDLRADGGPRTSGAQDESRRAGSIAELTLQVERRERPALHR